MRIPINWLEEHVRLPSKLSELTNRLTYAGHMLDKIDKINENTVIDLELRGNRADCYSIMGIAKEVSALFKTPLKKVELLKIKSGQKVKDINITVKSAYLQRVMAIKITDVKIGKSPSWLKDRLMEYGITPINNLVDLTNYVMVETGQPMHAFDFDKIGSDLEIRTAEKNEKIVTFLGNEIVLDNDDLVWANKGSILSVAGAIGGKNHSISDDTKTILLETASYDQANIRRTVHKHNLLTDAGLRHEKDLDPNLVELGFCRFLYLLDKNGWGDIAEPALDFYPKPIHPWKVSLNYDYLKSFSGVDINKENLKVDLKWLNFITQEETAEKIDVLCPTYRTDVKLEEDLIEEIIRLYGYEKIPASVLSLEIPKNITPDYVNQEIELKNHIIHLGYDEVISSPFVIPDYQKLNFSLSEKASPVTIINRPSPEIEEMRMTLIPSLLGFVKKIINERGEEARIFEIGKIYFQKNDKYIEKRVLGISYWKKSKKGFRKFKGYLDSLIKLMRLADIKFKAIKIPQIYNSYNLILNNEIVGVGGQIDDIYFAEIYLDALLGKSEKQKVNLWQKYPPQIEDLTIKIPKQVEIGKVIQSIKSANKMISKVTFTDRYKDNYTFRIYYQHSDKTLSDKEVEEIRKVIVSAVKKQ